MKVRVLVFAAARDLAGSDCVEVRIDSGAPLTVSLLRTHLLNQIPELQRIGHALLWAVNNAYAADSQVISVEDTVACFPPVSGG